jgi:hypothetical protein
MLVSYFFRHLGTVIAFPSILGAGHRFPHLLCHTNCQLNEFCTFRRDGTGSKDHGDGSVVRRSYHSHRITVPSWSLWHSCGTLLSIWIPQQSRVLVTIGRWSSWHWTSPYMLLHAIRNFLHFFEFGGNFLMPTERLESPDWVEYADGVRNVLEHGSRGYYNYQNIKEGAVVACRLLTLGYGGVWGEWVVGWWLLGRICVGDIELSLIIDKWWRSGRKWRCYI